MNEQIINSIEQMESGIETLESGLTIRSCDTEVMSKQLVAFDGNGKSKVRTVFYSESERAVLWYDSVVYDTEDHEDISEYKDNQRFMYLFGCYPWENDDWSVKDDVLNFI